VNQANGADLRYLLVTAIDDQIIAGEDDYEIAAYFLLENQQQNPWERRDLVGHSIAPSSASSDTEIIKQAQELAKRLEERNSKLNSLGITFTMDDLPPVEVSVSRSEEEFIAKLTRMRAFLYTRISDQSQRVLLEQSDRELLRDILGLRQTIQDRNLGINGNVSQISHFANQVFSGGSS
jgi:hypothetical protein